MFDWQKNVLSWQRITHQPHFQNRFRSNSQDLPQKIARQPFEWRQSEHIVVRHFDLHLDLTLGSINDLGKVQNTIKAKYNF